MKDDNEAFKGSPYLTSTRGRTPPLVTSNFVVQDDGMIYVSLVFLVFVFVVVVFFNNYGSSGFKITTSW